MRTKTYLVTTYIPAILRFLYLASLFLRGSLIFANAARSMFILHLTRPIKYLNLIGSGDLNFTALHTAADIIWSTNTYEQQIQSIAVMLFSCFVLSFFIFVVQFCVHLNNIL